MSTYWLFRYLNTGPFHVTKFKSHYLAVSRKVCWKISTLVFSSPELKGLFPPNLAQSVLCNWLMMFKFVWKKGLRLSIKKIHVKATLLKSFLLEPGNYYFNQTKHIYLLVRGDWSLYKQEIITTLNKRACIIIDLFRFIYCLEMFLMWAKWPIGLLLWLPNP